MMLALCFGKQNFGHAAILDVGIRLLPARA
jgi:hypothetical protein